MITHHSKSPELDSATSATEVAEPASDVASAPQELNSHACRSGWADRILAGILLALFWPVLLLLMGLVRLTSPGKSIYAQERVGKNGRTFDIYKLRTMWENAEARTGPIWASTDDPRVTWLGKYLRLLHLDELPQLINVLRGDMAFVGPRPERPVIIEQAEFAKRIPGYHRRHQVLPGITGLAQINLPPDVDLDSVRDKVELDLEYIANSSFGLDLRIVACTALRMLGIRGGRAVRWMRLERIPRRLRKAPNRGPSIDIRDDGAREAEMSLSGLRLLAQTEGSKPR